MNLAQIARVLNDVKVKCLELLKLLKAAGEDAKKQGGSLCALTVQPCRCTLSGSGEGIQHSLGIAPVGAGIEQTNPAATQCVLTDFSYYCEHEQRPCNTQRELWVVPNTLAGDAVTMKPTVRNGSESCISYELDSWDGRSTNQYRTSRFKVPGWHSIQANGNPIAGFLAPEFFPFRHPRIYALRAKGANGQAAGSIHVYPSEKVEFNVGTDKWAKRLKEYAAPLVRHVKQWTGKDLDFTEPQNIGGPFWVIVNPPAIALAIDAQWQEHPRNHAEWWKAYCNWGLRIRAEPLLGLSLRVDLMYVGATVLSSVGPGLTLVYERVRPYLNNEGPPMYLEISLSVSGELNWQCRNPDRSSPGGEMGGMLGVKVGIELKNEVVAASLFAATSGGLTVSLETGGDQAILITGLLKWEGVKGVASIELSVGKLLKFGFQKELTLIEGGDLPLVRTQILPDK